MSFDVFELRDYQVRAISMIYEHFAAGDRAVLLNLPTGGGKTVIAGAICQRVTRRGKMVLFVVNKIELATQAVKHFRRIGLTVSVLQGDNTELFDAPDVCVATVQTLSSRGWPPLWLFGQHEFRDVGVVIVDETHVLHQAHIKLLDKLQSANVIGLTATPLRADLGKHYDSMVTPVTIRELTDQGHLVPAVVFQPSDEARQQMLAEISIDYARNDFNNSELGRAMSRKTIIGDLFSNWQRRAFDRQTLIFACNVAHAETICDQFAAEGVDIEVISYHTDSDVRAEIIERYRCGDLQVLVSVDALSEGFDVPSCACLVLARPTLSETVYRQQIGRGLRTAPGKSDVIILDHAGNVVRHGLPVDFEPPPLGTGEVKASKKTLQQIKARVCPECTAVLALGTPTCSVCGHDFPTRKPRVDVIPGELVAIDQAARPNVPSLAERRLFYRMLKGAALNRGFKVTAAYPQYIARFGEPPPLAWRDDSPLPPTPEVSNWVQRHLIAYWRSQKPNPPPQPVAMR